jgi:tetratricopeptide (TPR) repeat protein
MNKTTLIVVLFSIGLVGLLYSLPKSVVSSQSKEASAEKISEGAQSEEATEVASDGQHGASPLSAEQSQELSELKAKLGTGVDVEKLAAISDAFFRFQKFDSSAVYAAKIADLEPTAVNFLKAGDRYYEAYSFSVGAPKSAALGVKTREYYQKALDLNPNYTLARANMAMTYVNTDNPMQGISMLREILDEDPTNEIALFNMGLLSMRSNQYSRAVQRFSQIVSNNPANIKAKFYLALSLVEMGKPEDAGKLLAEVKEKEKDPMIQKAIAELESRL